MDEMRRPDGTGTKDILPSGKIRCRVRQNGRRVTRIYATEAQADRFLRGAAALAAAGEHEIGVPLLGAWGARWLEKRQTVSARWEQSQWRNHVEGTALAKLPVQDVRLRHLRAWAERELPQHRALLRSAGGVYAPGPDPISVNTRRLCLGLVRRVLAAALEEELITINPAAGLRVKWPDAALDDERSFLEEAEIIQLLGCEAVPVAARLHYGWAIGAGPRQGENRALRWGDAALDDLRCTIRRAGARQTTKADKLRPFALLPLAAESLLRWRELAPDTRPDALVWPTRLLPPAPGGTRWRIAGDGKLRQRGPGNDFGWADRSRGDERGVARGHRSLAGIRDGITYHDLRHTACAGLLRGYAILGVTRRWTIDEVCDWIGHSSRQVTERYAHIVGGGLADRAAEQSIDRARGSRLGHALPPARGGSPTAEPSTFLPVEGCVQYHHDIRAAQGLSGVHDPRVTHGGWTAETAMRRVLQLLASGDPHAVRRVIEFAGEVLDETAAVVALIESPARRRA